MSVCQCTQFLSDSRYSPAIDQYSITDGDFTRTANVFFSVFNQLPSMADTRLTVEKNIEGKIPLTLHDDDELDTLTCEIIGGPSKGQATLLVETVTEMRTHLERSTLPVDINNYTLVYKPNNGVVGDDSVELRISDGYDSIITTLPIEVVNSAPVAVNDTPAVECLKNTGCSVDFSVLLSNDYDRNGDDFTVDTTYEAETDGRSIVFDSESQLATVVPNPNQEAVTFKYRITDAPSNPQTGTAQVSEPATVYLPLVNKAPVAVDHSFKIPMKKALELDLLEGCTDPNNDELTIVNVGQTTSADLGSSVITIDNGKKVLYTSPHAIIRESFTYTISDPEGKQDSGIVDINVVNTPPHAQEIKATTHWRRTEVEGPLEIDITNYVSDDEGSPVKLDRVVSAGLEADVIKKSDSLIHFKPRSSIRIGDLSFDYVVTDGFDETISKVRNKCLCLSVLDRFDPFQTLTFFHFVQVTVTVTNSPPTTIPFNGDSVHHSNSICFNPISAVSDPDGDPVYLDSIIEQPKSGTAAMSSDGSTKCINYKAAGVKGEFFIEYRATDTKDVTSGVVKFNVTNTKPVAKDDHATLHWRNAISNQHLNSYNVLNNDSDNDNDPIHIMNANRLSGEGEVVHDADKVTIKFPIMSSPPPSWKSGSRETVVSYTISDGCETDEAFLTVQITNTDQPVADTKNLNYHWRMIQDSAHVLIDPLDGVKTDANGDTLSLSSPSAESADVSIEDNMLKFSMHPSFKKIGEAVEANVVVSDGLDSAIKILMITATNTPPKPGPAVSATYRWINFGNDITIKLTGQASDVDELDREHLSISTCEIESAPAGTKSQTDVTVDGSGCTFRTSECAMNDVFTLRYWLTDGRASVDNTITIGCDNETVSVPFTDHWRDVSLGKSYDFLKTLLDSGRDLSDNVVGIYEQPEHGSSSLTADNALFFTFNGKERSALGEQTTMIEMTGFNNVPVVITVTNDAPICFSRKVSGHWRTIQGTALTIKTTQLANDLNHDPLTIKLTSDGERGTALVSGDTVSYTLGQSFKGNDEITYSISDGIESCASSIMFESTNTVPNRNDKIGTFHWLEVVTGTASIDLLEGASDHDGDPIHVKSHDPSSWDSDFAELTFSNNTLSIKRAAANIAHVIGRSASVSFTLTDGVDDVNSIAEFTVFNNRPTASSIEVNIDATARMTGGRVIGLGTLANFQDKDAADVNSLKIVRINPVPGTPASNSEMKILPGDRFVQYTPPSGTGDLGTERFTFIITDGAQESDPYTLTMVINNNPPEAEDITRRIRPDDEPELDVIVEGCRDMDIDDDLYLNFLYEEIVSDGTVYGTLEDKGNGKIKFNPGAIPESAYKNDQIIQKFSFTCRDLAGSTATGSLIFIVSMEPPEAKHLTHTVVRVGDNGPVVDYDLFRTGGLNPTNDPTVKLVSVSGRSRGVATKKDDQTITFTPEGLGKETVSTDIVYTITNGYRTASNNLTITYRNLPPECTKYPQTILQKKRSTQSFNAHELYGIRDPNNDPVVSYTIVSDSQIVSFDMNDKTGNFSIQTKDMKSGDVHAELVLSDGTKDVGRCRIEFHIENNKPTADDFKETFYRSFTEHIFDIPIQGRARDPDEGDTVFISDAAKGAGCEGTISFDSTKGLIRYKTTNEKDQCVITYRVNDTDNNPLKSDPATVTISFKDSVPHAVDDSFNVTQGGILDISFTELLQNDFDLNNDILHFDKQFFDDTTNGTCTEPGHCRKLLFYKEVNGIPVIRYEASNEDCDSDKFRYRIWKIDGSGERVESNIATVTISQKNCVCKRPVDIVLVIDGSLSIQDHQWREIKSFTKAMVSKLKINKDQVHLGLVQFGKQVFTTTPEGFPLSQDENKISKYLDGLKQVKGYTNTRGGLRKAMQMLEGGRENVPKVAVLLTDGDANQPCACGDIGGEQSYGCNYQESRGVYMFGKLGRNGPSGTTVTGRQVCDWIGANNPMYPKPIDCNICSFTSRAQNCHPCADPTYEAQYMKEERGIRVVAFAVGKALSAYGKEWVKQMHYENEYIEAKWNDDPGSNLPTLDELMSKIVDLSCSDNESS